MSKKRKVSKNKDGKRIAFVISPIGGPDSPERKRADQILKHIIEPIVAEFGYKAVRADNIPKPGTITTQVISNIINDPLVIADLTGHNPNVFYELAVRHAIKKPVIQIIRKGEKIPFDVSTQRTIMVDHKDLDSVAEARKELRKQIKAVEKDPALVDSPISAAINLEFMKQSADPERKAIAEFSSMLQEVYSAVKQIRNELGMLEEKLPRRWTTSIPATESAFMGYPRTGSIFEPFRTYEPSNLAERIDNVERTLSTIGQAKKRRAKKDK